MMWELSSSSDRRALDVVDGSGAFEGAGPHYSRRTPGSKTFTGCGQEIVLVTRCGRAVWACVYQRTPAARGSGNSRGRATQVDVRPRYLWRNMIFRNLGAGLSSELIRDALDETYRQWIKRYGELPPERLRTEIDVRKVRSRNPGYCYAMAGWERGETRNGKLFYWAPKREATMNIFERIRLAWGQDTCAPGSAFDGPNGQCAVTALVVQDIFGGELLRAECLDRGSWGSHYWNQIPGMGEVDLTRAQFEAKASITPGVVVPRSRLLDGERAVAARTPERYAILKARVGI